MSRPTRADAPRTPGARPETVLPRVGFLGVGWIGRNRMEAIARSGAARVSAVADASAESARAGAEAVGCGRVAASLDELLAMELDAIVIATPSSLHAAQAVRALEAGLAVFCQKPLGRDAAETRRVVEAARRADRLLGVDLSYRQTAAVQALKRLLEQDEIGRVHAVDLVFHNAYGPDKPWFYDPALSGGGCVIDLGIHLVDLALWCLRFPRVHDVRSRLFSKGQPLVDSSSRVEDLAMAQLELADGTAVHLACSWRLHAGRDCVIEASFFGTRGGATFRNVDGSFYDFRAELHRGTATETLVEPPDPWGGRAAVRWVRLLATGAGYDPEIEQSITVAETLDRIYRRPHMEAGTS